MKILVLNKQLMAINQYSRDKWHWTFLHSANSNYKADKCSKVEHSQICPSLFTKYWVLICKTSAKENNLLKNIFKYHSYMSYTQLTAAVTNSSYRNWKHSKLDQKWHLTLDTIPMMSISCYIWFKCFPTITWNRQSHKRSPSVHSLHLLLCHCYTLLRTHFTPFLQYYLIKSIQLRMLIPFLQSKL